MAQVSTDKIKERIGGLRLEIDALRARENAMIGASYSPRDNGMEEHFAIQSRLFAIKVLEEFVNG
jgi:hypothetical protein